MIIIDRFEGDIAVLETDDGIERIPRAELPSDAGEGDVLTRGGPTGWQIDTSATSVRLERMRFMLNKLTKRE